jgi:hypothetical protein
MHDTPLNQAAGLMGLAPHHGAQLIAMTSHGDDKTELPLLWQLCTSMVHMGYAVTVLDATKTESAANPGLCDLLDYRFGYGAPQSDAPDWTVVPCAQGLHTLCNLSRNLPAQRQRNLQRIGELFPPHGVVILYAGVDWLVQMLAGTTARPLLTVAEDKTSLLTSYLALKGLLRKGGLEPTVLNIMHRPPGDSRLQSGSVAGNLAECARNFLDFEVNATPFDLTQSLRSDADMRRLAMRLLESALALNAPDCGPAAASLQGAGSWIRSH